MMFAARMMCALRHIGQTSHHCDQREQHHFERSEKHHIAVGDASFDNEIEGTYTSLSGSFRIYDVGADTDGYIELVMTNGKLSVKGQLGASFSSHSLMFEFEADQTLVGNLLQEITF